MVGRYRLASIRVMTPPRSAEDGFGELNSSASLPKRKAMDNKSKSFKKGKVDDADALSFASGDLSFLDNDVAHFIECGSKAKPWSKDDESRSVYFGNWMKKDVNTSSKEHKQSGDTGASPSSSRNSPASILSYNGLPPVRLKSMSSVAHDDPYMFSHEDVWPIQPVRRIRFLGPGDESLMPKLGKMSIAAENVNAESAATPDESVRETVPAADEPAEAPVGDAVHNADDPNMVKHEDARPTQSVPVIKFLCAGDPSLIPKLSTLSNAAEDDDVVFLKAVPPPTATKSVPAADVLLEVAEDDAAQNDAVQNDALQQDAEDSSDSDDGKGVCASPAQREKFRQMQIEAVNKNAAGCSSQAQK